MIPNNTDGTGPRLGDVVAPKRLTVIVVDARSPDRAPPLRELLDALDRTARPVLVDSSSAALTGLAVPDLVLVHAGLRAVPGIGGAGPAAAEDVLREAPHVPVVLYSGSRETLKDPRIAGRPLARWVFTDMSLAARARSIVPLAVDFHRRLRLLYECCRRLSEQDCDARSSGASIPKGFHLDRFVPAVRNALAVAAARAHSRTAVGAPALGVPERTYRHWLTLIPMPEPLPPVSNSPRAERLLWISYGPPPRSVAEAAERERVEIDPRPPGALHPRELEHCSAHAVIIDVGGPDVRDVDGPRPIIDAFVVRSHLRTMPMVLCGRPEAPSSFLIARMGLAEPVLPHEAVGGVLGDLLAAGRAGSLLAPETDACRFPSDDWSPRWVVGSKRILKGVTDDILLLADRSYLTKVAAANALGLPHRTFQRRLARARAAR